MHALMGKSSNKSPTPQELYRARKQKEEDEKNAFLPPGLVNHGNTCFMNSVLQGLIATPMLVDIVRFSLPRSYAPVSSRRSPQLTNAHGVGGEFEREREMGMPLGDTFIQLMLKAWKIQDERMRQSMSPKELLQTIGSKFDQYLDFRQQDAHEFLRHLLDAMRMEELDIIKKRQPPPPKSKRKSKSRTKSGDPPSPSKELQIPEIPEEDRLTSFVDMVFGGRLASILVCSKCQKISCTYEDFNDLSLPIKQDDYYHTNLLKSRLKKKDRFKSLAKKLGAGMSAASAGMGMRGRGLLRELEIPEERGPRSSSVPASPLRRSEEAEKSFELLLGNVDQRRRRSLEAGEETPSLATAAIREQESSSEEKTKEEKGENTLSVPEEGQGPGLGLSEDDDQKVLDSKRGKEKDADGWIKLRRKISVSMGGKKGHHHKKKRGQDVPPVPDLPREIPAGNDDSQGDNATITTSTGEGDNDEVLDSFVDVKAPSPTLVPASLSAVPSPSPSMSPLLNATVALQRLAFVRRPSSRAEKAEKNSRTNSPALSASVSNFTLSRPRTPDIPSVSLPPMISPVEEETQTHEMRLSSQSRPASPVPAFASASSGDVRPKPSRQSTSNSKTESQTVSKPSLKSKPKHKRSESFYLRRLLADVPISSASSSGSHAPFNLGQSQGGGWSKLGLGLGFGHGGTVQSVEGCLRMFTAVEVLEGENMVGCRRCWKIQHGQYVPREKKCVSDEDEDGEGEDEDEAEDGADEEQEVEAAASDSSASVKVSLVDSETRPRQDQAAADESMSSSLDLSLSEHISVHSAPAPYSGTRSENAQDMVTDDDAAPGLGYLSSGVSSSPALACPVPVPSISMTRPESATATAATTTSSTSEHTPTMESPSHAHTTAQNERLGSSPSRDSLQLPQTTGKRPGAHFRQPAERSSTLSVTTSDTSSLSSGGETTEDESDGGEDDGETETSLTASVRSDVSSIVSAPQEPPGIPRSSTTLVDSSSHPSLSDQHREASGNISNDGASNQKRSGTIKSISNGTDNTNINTNTTTSQPNNTQTIPRSKQVILRRAYKRYLIASPPPVLVVHLKRFQQIGRPSSHLHSLSGLGSGSAGGYGQSQYQFFQANFKKLDDAVRFPEYLDLSPFLLPSKDEVLGEGKRSKGKRGRRGKKKKKKKKKSKDDEKDGEGGSEEEQEEKLEEDATGGKVWTEGCMYRLYAVVVHIGNMLGGHYVAYTALPEPAPSLLLSSSASTSSSSTVPAPSNSSINEGNPSSSPSSTSLPPSSSIQAQTQTPHPEVPRTTSFTRTAIPHPHSHSHSHSHSQFHTHSRSSNVNVASNSHSRPSSSSGAGRISSGVDTNATNSQKSQKSQKPESFPQRQWCYVSDTIVRLASLEEVLQAKAYICMYERI